ncbi:pseudouridine synthase [Acidaminococcus fermentans]|uniref:pseudouridine synthase n=1 Tax=Acidaminococcus fermentans TaxID=905 RepID=UPI00243227D8|nr:pseudouridine synthase [Acidaminococcus fermentans]MDD6286918.1 pseudouridine synthase [Acidaminococcus fermentans]
MEQTKERLQKVMAAAGVASRRECEKIILAGRVQVNGKPVTELGTRVGKADRITVDGKALHRKSARHTYLLYKPGGVVTTMKDPQGRRTVADLMAGLHQRLYPVGRLDYLTEGLLLMTNDGELAQHLTHPSHHVDKTYEVEVHGRVPEEKLDVLRLGVPLEDGLTAPAVVYVKKWDPEKNLTWFTVTIHEGRNRQVRRMCDFIGFPVKSLKRIQVGTLTLEGMKKGEFRELTPEEVASLESPVEK